MSSELNELKSPLLKILAFRRELCMFCSVQMCDVRDPEDQTRHSCGCGMPAVGLVLMRRRRLNTELMLTFIDRTVCVRTSAKLHGRYRNAPADSGSEWKCQARRRNKTTSEAQINA